MSNSLVKLRKIRKFAKKLSETIPTKSEDNVYEWMEKVRGLCESCDHRIIKDNIPIEKKGAFETAVNKLRKNAGEMFIGSPKVKQYFDKLLSSLDAALQTIDDSSHFIKNSQSEKDKFYKSNVISQNHDERLEERNKVIEKNDNKNKKKVPWFKDLIKLTQILVFFAIITFFVICISVFKPQRVIVPYFKKLFNLSEKGNSSIHKDEMEISHEDENVSELQLTYLNDLAIKAGYGDRHVFEELRLVANSNGSEESNFAKKVVAEIIKKYSGMTYDQVTINTEVPNYIVIEALNDTNPDTRKMAIYTVKIRKLYSEIPTLISMIESEDDLDVLSAIYRTLNKLLSSKVSMFHQNADSIFQSAWNKKRNKYP